MPNAHIKQTPLREVLENDGLLAVLRFQQTVAPFALARALISMSRSNYNILRIETGGRLLARLAGRLPGGANAADQSVICSVFVANVLKMATGKSVLANVLIATPADFAASEEFSTVELEWCRVVSL